jgi:hypothetical protein
LHFLRFLSVVVLKSNALTRSCRSAHMQEPPWPRKPYCREEGE